MDRQYTIVFLAARSHTIAFLAARSHTRVFLAARSAPVPCDAAATRYLDAGVGGVPHGVQQPVVLGVERQREGAVDDATCRGGTDPAAQS